jgi:hypothetical protein
MLGEDAGRFGHESGADRLAFARQRSSVARWNPELRGERLNLTTSEWIERWFVVRSHQRLSYRFGHRELRFCGW